jgi:acyl-CoA dehydrogenase
MFIVEMTTPGIDVRPIKQANGASGFNEVFLSDVRIADANRLGPVGKGWEVSLTTLMNERMSVAGGMQGGFPELLALCEEIETDDGTSAFENPAIRSVLARLAVRYSGLHFTALRGISALSRGDTPGPENSINKLVASSLIYEFAALALDLQGMAGIQTDRLAVPSDARFQDMLLRSPGTRIEGGTDEILRNIIAERVLGLPADIRVDKNIPFSAIPTHGGARR